MKNGYLEREIISNVELVDGIYKMRLAGKFGGRPGQFYMLRGWKGLDPFLSRPLSINDLGQDYIDFLYQDVGRGTELLSVLRAGDRLELLGPLGNGFEKIEAERIALVGGGIGIAPLLYLAKEIGGEIDFYGGFRDQVYELDSFKKYVDGIYISTETGSQGHRGLITELIDYDKYDLMVTCGPRPMMEALYREREDLIVSMEERMACGIGACMGCNIRTRKGNKKVCKDGPVFMAKEVFIDA